MRRGIALLTAACLLLLLGACAAETGGQQGEGYTIYYLARSREAQGGDAICPRTEQLDLPEEAGPHQKARAVVERLLEGPTEEGAMSPFPAEVELLGVEIQSRRAVVDFSDEFRQLSDVDLLLADYCLTLSLAELEGISAVSVTARGRVMPQQPKRVFYPWDVLLTDRDDVLQTVEATLYFRNAAGALEGERRLLEVYEGQTMAEALLAALMEGPKDPALTAVLPENFFINSVKVDTGVCYVNLPAAVLETLPETEREQRQILWSLADSLYSLETVEAVRLLADGEELAYFGSVPVESVAVRPQG